MNLLLLLWGAETWSLRKTQLDQLEVFLHRSIRRILQISMSTVKEERIRNERVREMFYSIPCVRKMIASRQADFIGKMIRGPPDRPSRNMITACCDHKRRVGRPQTTGSNLLILPTLRNTIPNGDKSDAACLNHSRFLGLDLEHPKLKSGFTIDNSRASIILTRILQRSLA